MAKRLMVLAGALAMLLAAAVPVLAQEQEADQSQPTESPPDSSPAPADTVTLSFELTVRGEPPAGTTLLGFIPAEGGIRVPLSDADGDGVFTGSTTLDRFGPGPRPVPPGTQPVSLPVQIAQEDSGGNIEVIRDFGEVALTGDRTFKARVNFKNDDREDTTSSGGITPDTATPNPVESEDTSDPTDPENGVDLNEDGVVNETDGEIAAAVSDTASETAKSSGQRTLPATGGVTPPFLLVAGLILAISGLLARRVIR